MIKIKYLTTIDLNDYYNVIKDIPLDLSKGKKERIKFNKEILKHWSSKRISLEELFVLCKSKKIFDFDKIFDRSLTFKRLIIDDFEGLLNIKENIFYNRIKQNLGLKFLFNYSAHQGEISLFLTKNVELQTCYYCNIDFINLIKFYDVDDFLNNAPEGIVKHLNIPEKITNIILKKRKNEFISSSLVRGQLSYIESEMQKINSSNFFTIDHVIDKVRNPWFSLSLKNLVPCCYACNSKLKRSDSFGNVSPTSNSFDFNNSVKFQLLQDSKLVKIEELIKDKNKIRIKLQKEFVYAEYINILRLNPRYEFHKAIVY
ncbi:MAG: hypothetical protein NTW54_03525 [Bacteroidetes bacterium]|nr:hypothetical protein [Bacteroidota bacterium]